MTASPTTAQSSGVSTGSDLFRGLAGAFPTGVCVVTVLDGDNNPQGLTTQSFVGLSLSPPLISVAIGCESRTLGSLLKSDHFVVNILCEGSQVLSSTFASKHDDKFAGLQWKPSELAGGAPMLLDGSVAIVECCKEAVVPAGDHIVLIGLVLGGHEFAKKPLMYYRRSYATWPEVKVWDDTQVPLEGWDDGGAWL